MASQEMEAIAFFRLCVSVLKESIHNEWKVDTVLSKAFLFEEKEKSTVPNHKRNKPFVVTN